MNGLKILSYCRITDTAILSDGRRILSFDHEDEDSWMLQAYKKLDIQYPKFHKMDSLCKGGFIAAELVLGKSDGSPKEDMAILTFNRSSSIENDTAFKATIEEDYFPAPSVFVYTLPNIVNGEIAIRHSIFGETSCQIMENFSADKILESIEMTCQNGTKSVLCGWVEQAEGHTDVLMFRVGEDPGNKMELTKENLTKIWNN